MSTAATEVVRITSSLKKQAEAEGELFNRRASDQIAHWARLGRTLERLKSVSLARVKECLSAELSVDELSTEERAVAYAMLHNQETNATFPDFGAHKASAGRAYTTLDDKGRVVRIEANGKRKVLK